eukprot:GFYU01019808.1.p1 GENE.GFYU01019808.1~~GFYU01019808.1.p1  ORF type:complete len:225 (+),score=41.22 GFYU01019808.1:91-765(+)
MSRAPQVQPSDTTPGAPTATPGESLTTPSPLLRESSPPNTPASTNTLTPPTTMEAGAATITTVTEIATTTVEALVSPTSPQDVPITPESTLKRKREDDGDNDNSEEDGSEEYIDEDGRYGFTGFFGVGHKYKRKKLRTTSFFYENVTCRQTSTGTSTSASAPTGGTSDAPELMEPVGGTEEEEARMMEAMGLPCSLKWGNAEIGNDDYYVVARDVEIQELALAE